MSGLTRGVLLTAEHHQGLHVTWTHRKQNGCRPGEEPLAGLFVQSPPVSPRWKAPTEEADVFYPRATGTGFTMTGLPTC